MKFTFDRDAMIKEISIAQEIINRINHDDRFDVVDDLPEDWEPGQNVRLNDISDEGHLACFDFVPDAYIYTLNEDFNPVSEVTSIYDFVSRYSREHEDEGIHLCVRKTSTSLFQIIKLVPRQEEN